MRKIFAVLTVMFVIICFLVLQFVAAKCSHLSGTATVSLNREIFGCMWFAVTIIDSLLLSLLFIVGIKSQEDESSFLGRLQVAMDESRIIAVVMATIMCGLAWCMCAAMIAGIETVLY